MNKNIYTTKKLYKISRKNNFLVLVVKGFFQISYCCVFYRVAYLLVAT
jgi:hypothetical protein